MGDLLDFYQLSRFDRNPERTRNLQGELDEAADLLGQIRRAAPTARLVLLQGNHEYRLRKYLWQQAPELSGLRSLKIDELLSMAKLRIEYIESGFLRFRALAVKHGNAIRSKSGFTATAELERLGVSGVSAHSHRAGQVYRSNVSGMYSWTECGCLCDLSPEYMEGQVPDWQHALAYGTHETGGHRFEIHLAPIIGGKILFAGREVAA